jgi:hypothetical protein
MQIQPDADRHHPDPSASSSVVGPADRGRRIFLTQVAGLATAAIGTNS